MQASKNPQFLLAKTDYFGLALATQSVLEWVGCGSPQLIFLLDYADLRVLIYLDFVQLIKAQNLTSKISSFVDHLDFQKRVDIVSRIFGIEGFFMLFHQVVHNTEYLHKTRECILKSSTKWRYKPQPRIEV